MDGIERIKVLASDVKDKPLLKIIDYLLSRQDMNEKYLNEDKYLKQMIEFIKFEAKKQATNGIAVLEDEEVYGLAIHYWDESNKDLKIKETKTLSEEIKEEKVVKPKEIKKAKTEWISEGQLTLFDF